MIRGIRTLLVSASLTCDQPIVRVFPESHWQDSSGWRFISVGVPLTAVNDAYNLGHGMQLQANLWYDQRMLKKAKFEVTGHLQCSG